MTSRDALAAMLGKTALFGGLDEAERKAIAGEMHEMSFDNGQIVFGRGDPGREIYLVTSGRVRLSVLTSEGRELSFAHAEAGQIFGEIAVLDGGARSADATAVGKTSAYTLTRNSLNKLIDTRSTVREAAIKFLCNRIREADQQMEGIALYPIEVRLARFFLTAARQKGPTKSGTKVTIELPISQSELALLIGASRPKVNAALALLEDGGAIQRGEKTFTCDIDELEAMAGGV